MDVAAHRDVRPNAGPFADYHIANHLSAGVDIGGRGDLRRLAAKGTNHVLFRRS